MATYVNDLRLKEIGTGESSGTWGTETNTNLELIGEALGFGTEAITTNADTHTTTVADGSTDPGRAMYLKYTGTLDSACTITIAPNTISRMHFIENATSGSQNIIISQGSGANVTIPAGDVKAVYLDGAGSGAAVTDAFASLNVVDLKVEDDLTVTDDLIVNGDIDLEGSIDVNGTANLDVVDIDGAVDMASTLAVGGVVTANAGVVVDNITIDGTEIDLSSGDLTIDVAGDIIFDAGGQNIYFDDAGTRFFSISQVSNDVFIGAEVQDKDLIFRGNDGGSAITALTLDMSDAGAATFNSTINGMTIANSGLTGPSSQNFAINTPNSFRVNIDSNNDGSSEVFVVGHGQTAVDNSNNVLFGITESGVATLNGEITVSGTKGSTAGIPSGIINSTDTTSLAAGNGGAINFSGVFHSGGNKTAYASIEASKETSTHNEYGAALVFKTREDQGTQNEHMRVTSTGHVLLGTTTNQGVGGISFQHNASAGYNIQQNMDGTSGGAELYVFRRNSTQIGSINQSSTNAVTYNTSSDARLKDVTGSARGLDVINNLNPVAYNWKADNHADEGLIAQEVEKLVPNAVNQDEDGYYSMDYSKLVTHLVKGMQEQQEQIESLKSEIKNLKEK